MSNPGLGLINMTFRADMTLGHFATHMFRNKKPSEYCNIQAIDVDNRPNRKPSRADTGHDRISAASSRKA
jgi:hypothetical protein